MPGRHLCGFISAGILLTTASGAHAQATDEDVESEASRDEDRVTLARRDFELGTARLHEGRFADGRDLLSQSLEASPRPGTAFNYALALRGTGEFVESVGILERLLAGEFGEIDEGRQAAEALRSELVIQVAELLVTLQGAPRAQVHIDGRERASLREDRNERLALNPGQRAVLATADGFHPFTRQLEISPGATERLQIRLEPLPVAETGGDGLVWVAIVGGIVLIAGAVTAGILLLNAESVEQDPVFGTARLP